MPPDVESVQFLLVKRLLNIDTNDNFNTFGQINEKSHHHIFVLADPFGELICCGIDEGSVSYSALF